MYTIVKLNLMYIYSGKGMNMNRNFFVNQAPFVINTCILLLLFLYGMSQPEMCMFRKYNFRFDIKVL